MGSLVVIHPASSAVQRLKMPLTSFLHAPCWKLNVGNCLAPPPPGNFGIWIYLTPHMSLIAFACIMLGIRILHQLSSRTQGLQSQTHPTVTTSHYLVVLSWNGRQERKKKKKEIQASLVCTPILAYWSEPWRDPSELEYARWYLLLCICQSSLADLRNATHRDFGWPALSRNGGVAGWRDNHLWSESSVAKAMHTMLY